MRKRLRSWSGPVLPWGCCSGEGDCFGEGELVWRGGEGGLEESVMAGVLLAAMGEERKEFLRDEEVNRKREEEGRLLC